MLTHHVLIDEQAIRKRVRELAGAIVGDLPHQDVLLVGLLTGSFVFLADLGRELARLGTDPRVTFVKVSHYGQGMDADRGVQGGERIAEELTSRSILLVDDILDTGDSLASVRTDIEKKNPHWLRVCVCVDKTVRRRTPIVADYVGFEAPDAWLIGYGLDLNGIGRMLPYIAILDEGGPLGGSSTSR